MEFGLSLAPYTRWPSITALSDVVQAADRLGFTSVALPDHVALPRGPEEPRSGVQFYDPFVLGSYLAARTSRIRFVFGALVVPLRTPLHLARLVASLDQVSGGRVTLVAGTGWMPSEFEALGLPFDERGPMTDEYLDAVRVLWTEENPSYAGRYVSFQPMTSEPRCLQRPHVPIWIAGTGKAPFRRLVRFGDGWMPMTGTFAERAEHIALLRREVAAAGRDPDALAFSGMLTLGEPDATMARMSRRHHSVDADVADARRRVASTADDALRRIEEAAAAGFTHLTVDQAWESPYHLIDNLYRFSEDVIGRLGDRGRAPVG